MAEPVRLGRVSPCTWPAGQPIHRIHADVFAPATVNASGKGDAPFSPLHGASGAVIPTLYGGSSFECAAMETAFHDVPFSPGPKRFAKDRLFGLVHSLLSPARALRLVDLRNTALRALGVSRRQLIDTDATEYPSTRAWARAIHEACDLQGLLWVSRQDDSATSIVLFGDRILEGDLLVERPPLALTSDAQTYQRLLELAIRIGVEVVPGTRNP